MGVPSPRVASVMGLLGLSQWVSQSGDVVCIQRARGGIHEARGDAAVWLPHDLGTIWAQLR